MDIPPLCSLWSLGDIDSLWMLGVGIFIFLIILRYQKSLREVLVWIRHEKISVFVDNEKMLSFLSYESNPWNPVDQSIIREWIVQTFFADEHAVVCMQRRFYIPPFGIFLLQSFKNPRYHLACFVAVFDDNFFTFLLFALLWNSGFRSIVRSAKIPSKFFVRSASFDIFFQPYGWLNFEVQLFFICVSQILVCGCFRLSSRLSSASFFVGGR